MFRSSEVTPYTAEDKQQLLIDAVKANNPKLVTFLLHPLKEDAFPVHSEEALQILELSSHTNLQLAEIETRLLAELSNFIADVQKKEKQGDYDFSQLRRDIDVFLKSTGTTIIAEALEEQKRRFLSEWPRLKNGTSDADGNLPPDLEACVLSVQDSNLVEVSYAEAVRLHEQQLSALLKAHLNSCAVVLTRLNLPIAENPAMKTLTQIEAEHAAKTKKLDEATALITKERSAVQSRQALITLGLDANYHFKIIMLQEAADRPEAIAKGTLLLQKRRNSGNAEDELVGYWMDTAGQVREQSVKLSAFTGITLPEPGQGLDPPAVFRAVTTIFGCTDLFDTFGAFGANVPERLRATPYEVRVKLTSTPFAAVVIPETGDTLAHIAAKAGHFEVFKLLIAHDENGFFNDKQNAAGDLPINAKNEEGKTLLSKAVARADLDQIEWLLNHGADRSVLSLNDLIPPQGITLLEQAFNDNNVALFQMYLKLGIDPMLENAAGKTMLDILREAGKTGEDKANITKILDFLDVFLDHLEKNTLELWPSNIRAIQKYIRAEHEQLARNGKYQLFENFLNATKASILHYMQKIFIRRIMEGWLFEKPFLKTDAGYRRFQLRWDDCNRILKAIRNAVTQNDPSLLQEALKEIKELFETHEDRRGALGGSSFRDKLLEIEVWFRQGLRDLDFPKKRESFMELELKKQEDKLQIQELKAMLKKSEEIAKQANERAEKYAEMAAQERQASQEARKELQEIKAELANLTHMFGMVIQQGLIFGASRAQVETHPEPVAIAPALTQSPTETTTHEDGVASGVQGVFINATEATATVQAEESSLPATASSFKANATHDLTVSTEEQDAAL